MQKFFSSMPWYTQNTSIFAWELLGNFTSSWEPWELGLGWWWDANWELRWLKEKRLLMSCLWNFGKWFHIRFWFECRPRWFSRCRRRCSTVSPKTPTLDCVLVQMGIRSSHVTSLSFAHQALQVFIDLITTGNFTLYCGSQGNQYLEILPTLCPFHTHIQINQVQDLPMTYNFIIVN